MEDRNKETPPAQNAKLPSGDLDDLIFKGEGWQASDR